MRKLTLEERITRLEKMLAKNEAKGIEVAADRDKARELASEFLLDEEINPEGLALDDLSPRYDRDGIAFSRKGLFWPYTNDVAAVKEWKEIAGPIYKAWKDKNKGLRSKVEQDKNYIYVTVYRPVDRTARKRRFGDSDADWETGLEPDQRRQRAADQDLRDTNYYGLGK